MESKTKQKILNFANTKEFNINDDGDNKLWAVNGSTVVHIEISKLNDGTEMVEFLSTVVIEPRIDEQLLRKLLALNANFNFGAFGMWDDGTINRYLQLRKTELPRSRPSMADRIKTICNLLSKEQECQNEDKP
jgi:hypothetical protein